MLWGQNRFVKPGWFVKTEFVKSGEHCIATDCLSKEGFCTAIKLCNRTTRDGQGSGWTVGVKAIFTMGGWWGGGGGKKFFDHVFPFYEILANFFLILMFLSFQFEIFMGTIKNFYDGGTPHQPPQCPSLRTTYLEEVVSRGSCRRGQNVLSVGFPPGKAGLEVRQFGHSRPRSLIRRSESAKDAKQLVDLAVAGKQWPLGELKKRERVCIKGGKKSFFSAIYEAVFLARLHRYLPHSLYSYESFLGPVSHTHTHTRAHSYSAFQSFFCPCWAVITPLIHGDNRDKYSQQLMKKHCF